MSKFLTFLIIVITLFSTNDAAEKKSPYSKKSSLDTQKLISKLCRYINKEGKNDLYTNLNLKKIESIEDRQDTFSPGTLILLGNSPEDIRTVALCLNNGQCSLLSENDLNFSICYLDELDFNQYPYLAVYKNPNTILVDKSYTEYLNLAVDLPFFLNEQLNSYFVNKENLPLVLSPKDSEVTLDSFRIWAETHQKELQELLHSKGAILLRGFPIYSAEDFAKVVKTIIGRKLIDYKGEGSRKRITQGVYTSTEAPPEFKIPLHNELTCTLNPVDYICFYCDIAPTEGTGQTLLGRTEDITLAIQQRPHIWDLFNGKIMHYISRHPPEGSLFTSVNPTHRTWQQAFETENKEDIEKICEQKRYDFKWLGDWVEVTRRVPAILGPDEYFDHPYWFNQSYLYHANPRIRGGWVNHLLANLLYISPSTRQYDIEFEDGSPIPQQIIYEIYDILDQNTILFNWEKGDVLLLDNRRTLHGRAPCKGQRRILATMIQ